MTNNNPTIAHIHEANGRSWTLPLNNDRVIIGRSEQADIVLDRSSISRKHAELTRDPLGRWWVRDLSSRGGIRVNNQVVTKHQLQPNDSLQISRFQIKITTTAQSKSLDDLNTLVFQAVPDELTANTHLSILKPQEHVSIGVAHLTRLKEFAEQLAATSQYDQRLQLLCQFVVNETFRGEFATVMRIENPTSVESGSSNLKILAGPISPKTVSSDRTTEIERSSSTGNTPSPGDTEAPYVSQTLIRAMVNAGTPVLANNTQSTEGQVEITLSGDENPMAAAAIPLGKPEPHQDLLYITLPAELGSNDWLALMSLAASRYEEAQAQWHARTETEAYLKIESELKKANEIQLGLIPNNPNVPGLQIAIDFQPCAFVGGDYVDVVPMADGRTLLILADVTGHGLPAALVAQSLHSIIRMSHRWKITLVQLIESLNDHLCETLNSGTFVTLIAIAFDPQTGDFEYINAGHPPVFIINSDGQLQQLNSGDHFPVGVAPQEWSSQSANLQPDQALMIYSDGLTEIQDEQGRLLNIDGLANQLQQLVAKHSTSDLTLLSQQILKTLEKLDNGQLQGDDRCFLLATRTT